jgi:hypothetical protein
MDVEGENAESVGKLSEKLFYSAFFGLGNIFGGQDLPVTTGNVSRFDWYTFFIFWQLFATILRYRVSRIIAVFFTTVTETLLQLHYIT